MTFHFKIFIISFLLIPNISEAQKIKRKLRGNYAGIIESYKINSGEDYLTVKETPINILVEKRKLTINIGLVKFNGVPKIKKTSRNIIELNLKRPNDFGTEKITIYRKNKYLVRKGISQQPNTKLLKQKKRD